jgi:putative spermidine/putrescine transport system ATP-binding protein
MTAVAPQTVTLQRISVDYRTVVAVNNVTLSLPAGEILALLGPSGCGKTTLLRSIAGFVPHSGEIFIGEQHTTKVPPHRRNIGMVFQDYALFPHMTAGENVAFGLRMRGIEKAQIQKQVEEALDLVQLRGLAERRPLELSGGQRQRVALARALVIRPAVLLLDEPLSNLDLKLREEMRVEIAGLQRRLGITTVFVTHDQGEALVMSDRIAVMNAGRIEQLGRPAEIYEKPATRFVAEFIGRMNFFARDGKVLAIRPERAKLSSERPASGFARLGTVRNVLYLGATFEYHLDLEGERALVEAPNDGGAPKFKAGEAVWFSAPPESCLQM